ncbi:unnamed protein product [Urochloa decumbens]|uniref:Uncharacterized protein n=1 Tax=Urochloa decumbens TaxID=240449 RepID=A0ABC8VD80_9POAL
MLCRGPPKKKKKIAEPSSESSIVPIGSTQKTMQFPPSQSASASLGSGHSLRSGSGSNQPEQLSIEYLMLPTSENPTPPATSKPPREKKAKGKTKAAAKKSTTKKKKKQVAAPHDSPAMGTRSKTTPQKHSPAAHTRSKRKLALPDLNI